MNGKVFIAFLIGLAVASGVTYYLTSKPEPVKTVAAQPAAAQQAPPTTDATAVQPAEPAPQEVKPSPVEPAARATMRDESRGARAARSSRPAHSSTTHSSAASTAQASKSAEAQKPVEVATATPAPAPVSTPAAPETSTGSYTMPPPPPPAPPKPNTVTVPAGTLLTVRLNETLNSERNHDGDSFTATLDQPLVIDGFVIAERGAKAQGRVVQSLRSGRVEGLAKLGLELVQLTTADGQKIRVNTGAFERQAETTRKKDAAKVGIGAALGAAIGAMAGGGKGAAIGAGVGGAAGAGDVLITRGKAAEIPVETRVSFRMKDPVTITEQLH